MIRIVRWIPVVLALATTPADTAERASLDFEGVVLPILESRCHECHGADTQEGRLRLDARQAVFKGGISGPAVVPGQAEASPLFRRVAGLGDVERMPPEEPLSPDEVGLLRRWIEAGAPWPADVGAAIGAIQRHWAYTPPERPSIPSAGGDSWPLNPIDHFIRRKQLAAQFDPAPPADKATLIRRVYLDLIGLPPSLDDVEAFVTDVRPDAYERLVQRLLASPQYGVRWARPWLDAARYADSNGYQADQYRSVWPYRDWVVSAMNADQPFDQFTVEQLAGDLLPASTVEQRIATGFHRLTTCNVEAGVDPEENRVNQIIDRVNTTGTVWLATTLECAQCHNHKYDPITQQAYYELFAFFNSTPMEVEGDGVTYNFVGPKMELALSDEQRARRTELTTQLERLRAERRKRAEQLLGELPNWEVAPACADELPDAVAKALAIPAEQRAPETRKQVEEYYLSRDAELSELDQEIEALRKSEAAIKPATTLVMVEQEPRDTKLLRRGDFLQPGISVHARPPTSLNPPTDALPGDRRGLAQWLVDPSNPLTARVAVNRWWAAIFGRGIVETLEDFGTQSTPPTHPQLLDWLAVELVDSGWSMKHVHRLIVHSATYRQSSRLQSADLQRDPLNTLYARGPRLRLPAETIRDNTLTISGLLCSNLGGPPVYPPQPDKVWRHVGRNAPKYATSTGNNRFRRGLYVIWRRSAPYPSFTNFDAPDRSACVVQRPRTNTPLQALTLLNDPAYVEMGLAFATRLLRERPAATVAERARYAWRLCLAREPRPEELAHLVQVYHRERERLEDKQDEALALVGPWAQGMEPRDVGAWFSIANILLNLDETITKN